MNFKKAVLVLAVLLAAGIGLLSVRPANINSFSEPVNVRLSSSSELNFAVPYAIDSFSISGSWEGPGFAQVWLVSQKGEFLVFDTRSLSSHIELSSFGSGFSNACIETCSLPSIYPTGLYAVISGPGVISIDKYHFSTPSTPSGLSSCPDCRSISQKNAPDHALFLVSIFLIIVLLGAHVLHSHCSRKGVRRFAFVLFILSFLMIGGLFAVSATSPTSAVTVIAKQTSSVLAAAGLIVVSLLIAFESCVQNKNSASSDLEADKNVKNE